MILTVVNTYTDNYLTDGNGSSTTFVAGTYSLLEYWTEEEVRKSVDLRNKIISGDCVLTIDGSVVDNSYYVGIREPKIKDVDSNSLVSVSGTVLDTLIDCDKFVNCFVEVFDAGAEITPIGTINPDNTSTQGANLIDNNLTNLVYNNSSAGSSNKSLPAIDLGSSIFVGSISLWWWSNTYTSTDYNIQISSDGTTWTDIYTGLDSTGQAGVEINLLINSNARYIRVFNITGTNATWVVISELKAFAAGTPVLKSINEIDDLYTTCNAGTLEVVNNSGLSYNIDINYLK